MRWTVTTAIVTGFLALPAACSDDDDGGAASGGSAGTSAGAAGTGAAGGGGDSGTGGASGTGAGATGGSSGTGGSGGTSGGGGGSDSDASDGASGTSGGTGSDASDGPATCTPGMLGGGSCTSARSTLLGPIMSVSTGEVTTLEQSGSVRTIYVDASAGGIQQAPNNAYVYVDLGAAARVSVGDPAADDSPEWEIAIKRDVLRTNGGDSGRGCGGAARLENVAFDAVTAASAAGATFQSDEFLTDATCEEVTDETGKPWTAFSDWYEYDQATNRLTPKPLIFLVRGADGTSLYKLQILAYYASADGGTGAASARYLLRYAPL